MLVSPPKAIVVVKLKYCTDKHEDNRISDDGRNYEGKIHPKYYSSLRRNARLNLGQRTKRGFSFRDVDLRWIVPSRIREHDCVPVSGGAGGGKINTTNTFCW